MSNEIEELKKSHQQLIDQAAAVMLCIEKLAKKQSVASAPEHGNQYWYVGNDGEVYETTFYASCGSDRDRVAIGNWFWTEEEAERAALRIKVNLLLRKEAEKLNGEGAPDFFLYYNKTELNTGLIGNDEFPVVLFTSKGIALEAASNVGIDLIKQAWSRDND